MEVHAAVKVEQEMVPCATAPRRSGRQRKPRYVDSSPSPRGPRKRKEFNGPSHSITRLKRPRAELCASLLSCDRTLAAITCRKYSVHETTDAKPQVEEIGRLSASLATLQQENADLFTAMTTLHQILKTLVSLVTELQSCQPPPRLMTFEEKRQLSLKINRLPDYKQGRVLDLIRKAQSELPGAQSSDVEVSSHTCACNRGETG